MPYIIRKVRNQDCYKVINKETKKVHSKCTTLLKAQRQVRLMQAVDHGFKLRNSKK